MSGAGSENLFLKTRNLAPGRNLAAGILPHLRCSEESRGIFAGIQPRNVCIFHCTALAKNMPHCGQMRRRLITNARVENAGTRNGEAANDAEPTGTASPREHPDTTTQSAAQLASIDGSTTAPTRLNTPPAHHKTQSDVDGKSRGERAASAKLTTCSKIQSENWTP